MRKLILVFGLLLGACAQAPHANYTNPNVGAVGNFTRDVTVYNGRVVEDVSRYSQQGVAPMPAARRGLCFLCGIIAIEEAPIFTDSGYDVFRGHAEAGVSTYNRQGRFDHGMYGSRGPYPYR